MTLKRPVIVLILALVAGLVATALTARWLHAQTADHPPLVVAQTDIPLGTPLEPGMLTTVPWPPSLWPQGAAQDPGALVGRVTRTSLTRHEPVLEARLAPSGSRAGLSAAISPGKRAMTVKVNEVVGVAGFALPGSLVDVIVNTQVDDSRQQASAALSKIALERILVLAVAQDVGRDTTAPRVANAVTLEVTPEQAERLDLARSVGTLSLVLRNPVDVADAHTAGARKPDLLAITSAEQTAQTSSTPIVRPAKATSNGTHGASVTTAGPPHHGSAHQGQPREAMASTTEVIRGTQRSTTQP